MIWFWFQENLILFHFKRIFDLISFQDFWFDFQENFLVILSLHKIKLMVTLKKLNHGMLLIGFISCLTYRKSSIFLCSYTAHDYYRKSQNILRCIFLYLLIFVRPFYFVLKNKNWLIIIFAKQRQQIIMMVFSLLIDKIAKITKKCTFTNLWYQKFA